MMKQISRYLTFIVGLLVAAEFFVKVDVLNKTAATIIGWMPVIGGFALLVGGLNLVIGHVKNVSKQKQGWLYSLVALVGLIVTVVIGWFQGTSSPIYSFFYAYILLPCSNTISALLAFSIASAAFRSFRARNTEGALLLFSGAIVMLGQAPFGTIIWQGFPSLANWIIQYPNLAAQRGLMIAAAVGFMSVSLRTIIGYTRSRLGISE